MLSTGGLGLAGEGAASYYTALARDDYYTQGGEPAGQWFGESAARLGLQGTVGEADLGQVLHGFDPAQGKPLTQGAGSQHYAGWDLTFNAPKSVSVLWAMTDDPNARAEIQAAQRAAVEAALAFAQDHCAYTRRGHDGKGREAVAGLAVALFEHSTSREQDPHLHTHCLVANLAQRQDGSFGALDGKHFFRWKMALGALYRAELAAQLQTRLHLAIARDGSSFAIAGVPKTLQQTFSKRSGQIQAWMAEHDYHGAKAAQTATLDTRRAKELIDRPALFERWQAEGAAADWGPVQAARLLARGHQAERLPAPDLARLREGLVENESTFGKLAAWRAMAEALQGVGDVGAVKEKMAAFWRDDQLVALGPNAQGSARWSTRALQRLEEQTLQRAERAAQNRAHALTPAQFDTGQRAWERKALAAQPGRPVELTPEQSGAVRYLCERSGAVAAVEGLPGTGKSFLLDLARETWNAAGYRVVGAAPTGKAALGLQEGAGIPSKTLHARLQEWAQPGALDSKTIVVLDEAGMVGSRRLAELMEITQTAGAKLVLVGDHRQLQPIEAGGMFRALLERMNFANLDEIYRQTQPWARDAVTAIAQGRVGQAIEAYEQRGLVRVGETKAETLQALVTAWAEAGAKDPQASRLMLAGERADVRALNLLAREHLQQGGALAGGRRFVTEHGPREFAAGDRVVFTRNSTPYGVRNGQLGTVEAISATALRKRATLHIRLDEGGQRASVPLHAYGHLDHGYALTTHKAQGATADRTFVLAGGELANREMGLVQISRHRQEAHLFVDRGYYEQIRLEHGPPAVRDAARGPATAPAASAAQSVPDPAIPVVASPDYAAQLTETVAKLVAQLNVSRQKDTTQDRAYQRQADHGQGLE